MKIICYIRKAFVETYLGKFEGRDLELALSWSDQEKYKKIIPRGKPRMIIVIGGGNMKIKEIFNNSSPPSTETQWKYGCRVETYNSKRCDGSLR